MTFGGGGGALQLDPSGPFTGTVKRLGAKDGIDLPNIAFGAQTTLAHSRKFGADTGGTLTVTDVRHAAAIVLLGNSMAGSFAAMTCGCGGALVLRAPQTEQPLLAHPPHG